PGVDIPGQLDRQAPVRREEPKSQDIYLRLLVKLHRFLARRSNSTFNQVVHESDQPAASLPLLYDPQDEASRWGEHDSGRDHHR
uniref:Large ribosomal subunit protein uL15/eL18 domain-containing protein n=1 Tax=Castor canadensis TaxID=51338 RepID=A0A8C0XJ30_CASCN